MNVFNELGSLCADPMPPIGGELVPRPVLIWPYWRLGRYDGCKLDSDLWIWVPLPRGKRL